MRDTAAFLREAELVYRALKLPPIGDITRPGRKRLRIALNTTGAGRGATAEIVELTFKTARLLEELGHTVEEVEEAPVDERFADDFLLYWGSLALVMLRTGRRTHGKSWDASRLDNLTHGLAQHTLRNLHRMPAAVRRLRATTKRSEDFHERYDVILTPTLASETPRVGHLDPSQDYDVLMDRILDWVAFTPLQNATGDPADLAAAGDVVRRPPGGHDVRRRGGPRGLAARAGLRARGGPAARPDHAVLSGRPRRLSTDFTRASPRVYRSPSLPL